jgi:hypothetical protein
LAYRSSGIAVDWPALMLPIYEVPGSDLGPETSRLVRGLEQFASNGTMNVKGVEGNGRCLI